MTGAVIDERRAEPEPVMVDVVENVGTNCGNINVPDTDEDECTVTGDELGRALEAGRGAALVTEAMWFSARSAMIKTSKEFCSA